MSLTLLHGIYPGQQVFCFTAAVEEAQRSSRVVQVAVEVLVQLHQLFLLLIRLVQLRKLWAKQINCFDMQQIQGSKN